MDDESRLTPIERGEIVTIVRHDASSLSAEEQATLSSKLAIISEGVATRVYQNGRCSGMQDAYEIVFNDKDKADADLNAMIDEEEVRE